MVYCNIIRHVVREFITDLDSHCTVLCYYLWYHSSALLRLSCQLRRRSSLSSHRFSGGNQPIPLRRRGKEKGEFRKSAEYRQAFRQDSGLWVFIHVHESHWVNINLIFCFYTGWPWEVRSLPVRLVAQLYLTLLSFNCKSPPGHGDLLQHKYGAGYAPALLQESSQPRSISGLPHCVCRLSHQESKSQQAEERQENTACVTSLSVSI